VARVVLAEVDSTMAEAQRRLTSLAAPTWILAHRQTAGRGRRGRGWSDPGGNFAATLVMRTDEDPGRLALRSFVAALALRDALIALGVPETALALKWPNDVLLNGGKLSGILLESPGAGVLAIGIGVNLANAPTAEPGAAFAPVSLAAETGLAVAPETLLDHLAPAFARWDNRLRDFGFSPVKAAFLRHAARLGQPLVARTHHAEHTGTFETLDDDGALVLRTAQGRLTIPAADIFFP
jgi:BirA family biotin operon repressor/biotin-[acetyl-CoA-carboxylase] ligase